MNLHDMPQDEINRMTKEFFSGTLTGKQADIKENYLKNIASIEKQISDLNDGISVMKDYLYESEPELLYEKCDELIYLSENITQQMRSLPKELPQRYKKGGNKMLLTGTNYEITFDYMDHNILHIILPDLLPPRKKRSGMDYNYLKSNYFFPFNREFKKGKFNPYSEKIVLVFMNYFEKKYLLKDHDNLDTKVITDIITMHMLIDDDPSYVSQYMDFDYADTAHTEIYVVPDAIFPNFIVWLNKNKGSRIEKFT